MEQSLEEILGHRHINPIDSDLSRVFRDAPSVRERFICWIQGEWDVVELTLDTAIDAAIASCS